MCSHNIKDRKHIEKTFHSIARVGLGVQDNSAQNQLGPCQLGPHKNRPMPTRPKMQNSAHTNSAQFKFYKRQLVPHFSGIEVCVFYHLLTARFAPRIKYPYPFVPWLTAQTQTTSHKLPYLVRSHAFIVNNNYIVLTTIIYLFFKNLVPLL